MRMHVREDDDEVCIELTGVAGRHQRVLQALTSGPIAQSAALGAPALTPTDVSVRAGADEMHIRLKGRVAHHFEALSIYHYLRHALIERDGDETVEGSAVAPRGVAA